MTMAKEGYSTRLSSFSGSGVFSFLVLFFGIAPISSLAAKPGCSTQFHRHEFSAGFDWTEAGKAHRPMRIDIGTIQPHSTAEPVLVAKISFLDSKLAQPRCHAVCRAKTFERDGATESEGKPLALEMSCTGSEFA